MEREMDKFVTVKVAIYGDPSSSVKVQVREGNSISAGTLFHKVCHLIGLSESSFQHFALFDRYDSPTRRYLSTDSIDLPAKDLTLRKWVFQDVVEKMLFDDSIAMELLCKHATQDIKIGILKPSPRILKQLEGCMDPDFPAGTQYLTLCQGLPGYGSEMFPSCVLTEEYHNIQQTLPKNSTVDVCLSKKDLQILSGNTELHHTIPWRNVNSWSICEGQSSMNFDLVVLGSRSKITFKSPQVKLILSVLLEIIKILMKDKKESDVMYFASDIKRSAGWMTYENHLYEPGTENPVFEHSPTYEEPAWSSI